MKRETNLQRAIMLALSGPDTRTWRNNVGLAVYPDGSRVEYGLCKGSSDLIGLHSVIITPEMIGSRVAIFTALEIKTARGRVSADQRNFLDFVARMGGIAGAPRSIEEAKEIIAAWEARIRGQR